MDSETVWKLIKNEASRAIYKRRYILASVGLHDFEEVEDELKFYLYTVSVPRHDPTLGSLEVFLRYSASMRVKSMISTAVDKSSSWKRYKHLVRYYPYTEPDRLEEAEFCFKLLQQPKPKQRLLITQWAAGKTVRGLGTAQGTSYQAVYQQIDKGLDKMRAYAEATGCL